MKKTNVTIYGISMYECHIDLYDQYFYVFFGEKNWKKFDKVINLELGEDSYDPGRACVVKTTKPHPDVIYMWFPNRDYENVSRGTLAHECIHLIDMVAINKGLKHDVNNQEVYAQFMGYIFKHLLPLFKKP